MKSITAKQAAEWCRTLGVPADPQSGPAPEILGEQFRLPEDSDGRSAVAAERVEHFDKVSRILIWITGWGVWPSIDRSDDFRAIRSEAGEDRWLDEIPAQLATKAEFDYVRRLANIAVSSLWDFYLIGPKGRKVLHFSHDEWGAYRGIPTMPKPAHPTAGNALL